MVEKQKKTFISNNCNKIKGITLIALVVTIIILLILAGVTIATLTGDNGLLQKTQNAQQANEEGKELELIELAVAAAEIAGEGTITNNNLNDELRIYFDDNTITVENTADGGWKYKKYKIYKDGKVEEIPNKRWLFDNRQNIVGNWDSKPYRSFWAQSCNWASQTYQFTIENNDFKITGDKRKGGLVYLTDIIDFSWWNNIYINVTSTDATDATLVLVKENGLKDGSIFYDIIFPIDQNKLYNGDISNVNELCYFGIYANNMSYLTFDECYLCK